MKAEELRIGNYIQDHEAEPEKTIYWKVEAIELGHLQGGKHNIVFRNGSCRTQMKYVEPVKISEEILTKLDFTYDDLSDSFDDNTWYKFTHSVFNFMSDKSVGFEKIFVTLNGKDIEMNYVHEFQDIYRLLTGKELILNL